MLRRLRIQGFKSLEDIEVELPPLTVLLGPNAVGKSNLLDAVLVLSRLATERTIADALSGPVGGHPIVLFAFPPGGLQALHERERARFSLEADLIVARDQLRYRVGVEIQPATGSLCVADEYLARLSSMGKVMGTPALEVVGDKISIRRKNKPPRPRVEPLGLKHTQISDTRFSGAEYAWIEKVRTELSEAKTYYLDPRVSMRRAASPKEVVDIGPLGEDLAPFLHWMRSEHPRHYEAVVRTLRTIVPAVESVDLDLDVKRGTLDIQITQDGVSFSSRIISEGTLRILALCAIAANPFPRSLIAFEEPENGVHPRRLQLIARLLASLAIEGRQQVIVTTHSPLFCQAMLTLQEEHAQSVALLVVKREGNRTICIPFRSEGPLFEDDEVRSALKGPGEGYMFEGLVLRGLVDD